MVSYASGGEGSWKSFFTTLPKILCRMHGSVLPHIAPQLAIVAGLGFLAYFWNPLGDDGPGLKVTPALGVRAERDHLPNRCCLLLRGV